MLGHLPTLVTTNTTSVTASGAVGEQPQGNAVGVSATDSVVSSEGLVILTQTCATSKRGVGMRCTGAVSSVSSECITLDVGSLNCAHAATSIHQAINQYIYPSLN